MPQTISPMACEAVGLLDSQKPDAKQFADWVASDQRIQGLCRLLGYDFKDKSLLLQALAHSSFCNEFPRLYLSSNERLEFLGDSVLQTLITSIIMRSYPHFSEGELSKLRDSLVNENSLASMAGLLKLGDVILLGRGEIKNHSMRKDTLLANLFEAVLGAIFYDGGYTSCRRVLERIFSLYEKKEGKPFVNSDRLYYFDAKSRLQERCMELYKRLPRYQEEKVEDGFKVELFISGKSFGSMVAPSKREGQKSLARQALEKLR
ncbi:MAG: ribonuclease III [Halobacteriovoraceae bacterium]|nr:ribonuclease III [Halobacteriovoraceae bacterium]